jgi:hypothetical protein
MIAEQQTLTFSLDNDKMGVQHQMMEGQSLPRNLGANIMPFVMG